MSAPATNLNPGSVGLLGFNGSTANDFSFVLLTEVAAGTVIYFTDVGILDGTGGFSNQGVASEGVVAWTAGSSLAAGTVINFTNNASEFSIPTQVSAGSVSGGIDLEEATTVGGVTTGGDQLVAFQADLVGTTLQNPRFLFAIQSNSNTFQTGEGDPTDPNTGGLPAGLVDGETALALGFGPGDEDAVSNLVYIGPTSGTTAELQAALGDPANWTSDPAAQAQLTTNFTITDAATANADPAISLTTPLSATEDTPLAITTLSVSDAEGDDLTVELSAPGTMTVGASGTVTGGGTSAVTISGTVAEVNAALAALVYTPTQDGTADETITVSVSDDAMLSFVPGSITVQITAVDDAPVLSDIEATVDFTSAELLSGPQTIFTAPTFTDIDTGDFGALRNPTTGAFTGGRLTVTATTGGLATDQLAIMDTLATLGPSSTQGIEVVGSEIFYTDDTLTHAKIGEIVSDGSNGTDLIVDFVAPPVVLVAAGAIGPGDPAADILGSPPVVSPAMVDEIIGALTFGSSGPVAGTRTISMTVTAPGGVSSNTTNTDISVSIANAAPTLSDLESTVSFLDSVFGSAQLLDADVTLTDPDSGDFAGGVLTVAFGSLRDPALENLGIRDSGVPGTGINVTGTVVSLDGNAIGSVASDGQAGNDLVVNLGVAATPAAVEALIEALEYLNTGTPPTGGRNVTITVSDGDGGISAPQTVNVQIVGVPPTPDLEITWTEGDPAKVIDDEATISVADPGAETFTTLTAAFATGGQPEDEFELLATIPGVVFAGGSNYSVTPDGGAEAFFSVSGGTGGAPLVLTQVIGTGATPAHIELLISAIAYDNIAGDTPTDGDRTVTFDIALSVSGSSTVGTFTVNVDPVEDVPEIANLDGPVSFDLATVSSAPQFLDTDVTLTDVDTTDFQNGVLVIANRAGGLAGDQLSVGTTASILVSGSNILTGGSSFATISGGANGADLVVTFDGTNGPVSAGMVEAVIEAIRYQNTAVDPELTRIFTYTLTDGEGGTSAGSNLPVTISGPGINPPPVIGDLAASVSFDRTDLLNAPQLIDTAVTVTDNDATGAASADFNGGGLRLKVDAARVGVEHRLGITQSGDFSISGTVLSHLGNRIGEITSDGSGGTDLIVVFDTADATAAAVEALVESLTYQNTAVEPETAVDLLLTLTDRGGKTSAPAPVRININLDGLARDDTVAGTEDTTVEIDFADLLANDLDFGVGATITGISGGSNGMGVIDGSTIRFTLNPHFNGLAGFDYTVSDGVSTSTAHVDLNIAPVNDAPTVTGAPSDVNVTEDTASDVDLSAMSFAEIEGDDLTVTLAASAGVLAATTGGGVTVAGSGTGTLTLSGAAGAINAFLDTASNVQYTGALDANGDDAATLTVSATDGNGGALVSDPVINLDIAAVNDKPTATGLPTDLTVIEDTDSVLDLSPITFGDVDSGSAVIQFGILADYFGTLSAVNDGSLASVTGTGTGFLVLSGTAAAIDAYLDTGAITYRSVLNANGDNADILYLSANDLGNSGSSTPGSVTFGTINVDITPVNDAPTVSGAPSDVSATEDVASSIDLSSMSFADIDGDDLTVTLAASAGVLLAPSSSGVIVTGSGTDTLTLNGSAAAINNYVDTVGFIRYTGAPNANGDDAATLTVSATDGNGGSLASDPVIDIDIAAVNDAPTVSGAPSDLNVTKDTASDLALGAMSFADIEGDSLTVTLAASAGVLAAATGGGVTVAGSGTGTLTLSGAAGSINTFLDTASNVQYTGAPNANGNDAATLTVSATDGNGGALVSDPVINLDIARVNDAPTVSGAPSDVSAEEDVLSRLDLSSMSFADIDGDDLTVTLTVSAGVLSGFDAFWVTVGGRGTDTLTLNGTALAINNFLGFFTGLVEYTSAADANGDNAATLTVSATDGNGGSLAIDPVINIDIAPTNDAPTVSGVPASLDGFVEDTAGDLDLSSLSFADIDGDDLTVTLKAYWGSLAAGRSGGVTVVGAGVDGGVNNALTLSGSAAAINAYLDIASNIQYTGEPNSFGSGAADLRISASDGNGGMLDSNPDIPINIAAVNDAPTVSGAPSDLNVTEDTASELALGAMNFADIEGDSLTVTLAASAGVLAAATGGGVTVAGSGTGTLTLSGAVGAINAFLDTASNVQYTGAPNANGDNAATLTVSASDGNGGALVSDPVINLDIAAVNDAPTVSGAPSDLNVTEDTASELALGAMSFADIEGDSLTVTLAASAGVLAAATGGGVTVAGSGTGTLTLSGAVGAINAFLDTASNVQYTGAPNANGNDAATLTVSATDGNGGALVSDPVINLDIAAVNDAPTVSGAPSDLNVTEDTASDLALGAMSFADIEGDDLTVTLAASAGVLAATTGGGVTVAGSGTGTLTLSGAVGAINAFLDTASNVQYTGAPNANGNDAATLTVSATDGNGGALVSDPVINLDIAAVNDAPTVSGAPSDLNVTEDTASDLALGTMSFADIEGDSLTVTLAASAGVLAAATGGGVTVAGSGTGTLTLSGAVGAINAFLDTASNVQYTGAPNANGNDAATLTVSATDGNGGALVSDPVINLDIAAVNDAPTVSGAPSDLNVTKDTASDLALGTMSFADIEGDSLTVTLAASAGVLAAATGGGVTVAGSGTGTLTLSGAVGAINAFLDTASNVQYTGAPNANGDDAATLTVSASDGNGGALVSDPVINLDIAAVNDAPTVSGAPSDLNVTEDTASDLALGAMSFADIEGDDLTVTLAASAGVLAATTGGGVTVAGSGTGTLTLSGAVGAINAFLDTASNVQYTGAPNANGDDAATLTVSATDGNGGALVSDPVINLDIAAVNDAPTVSGAPSDLNVTEDTASDLALGAMSFADIEGDDLTVTLAASAGVLAATTGGGVTVAGNGTGTLTLSGAAGAINAFLDTASNVQYTGAPNANGDDAATLTVSATDGNGGSLASDPVINLDIAAVNDAPTVSGAPSDLNVTKDTASELALGAMSFADIEGDDLTVTLAASAGVLAAATGGGVTVAGSGTGTLTLSGAVGAINAFLDTASNVQYTGAPNANGDDAATLTVSATDGNGGALVSDPVINLDIAAVNDAPTVSGAPSDLNVTEDTASDLALGAMSFADIEGDDLTVTLAASAGVLAAATGGGVTVAGSGTGTLTLSGAVGAINAFLDTASNVQYTGAPNANGDDAATLTVSATDGNGGSLASDPVINLDIAAVNDAPTVSGAPSDLNVTEDTASELALGAMSFADIEGDDLTVTLAASAGVLAAATGGGVTVAGSGTGTLTLSGAVGAINAFLDTASNVQYTGAPNANGDDAATLTVSATDGNGGALVSDPVINLDIAAVNDAPTVSGAPSDLNVTEDTASELALGAMSFADIEGDDLTVTLAASAGVLAATTGGGVTVAGSGTGTLTLSGAVGAINTFLDTASNVQYTGAPNANGDDAATLTVSATDGNGGSLASDPVIDIDIAAVNDAPTGRPAITGAATQDETLTADLLAVMDADGFDPGAVSWQWLRDGAVIGGANADSYMLSILDVGTTISVRLDYTDADGTLESLVSLDTDEVRYGDQTLFGDEGENTLRGRYGNDILRGRDGDDLLIGGRGRDILYGGDGDDELQGLNGNDRLYGGAGDDLLMGGKGADRLFGGTGADDLRGRVGNDRLFGGEGDDRLRGGTGDDVLTGGPGDDVFIFDGSDGDDRITDFGDGDDSIEILSGARRLGQLTFNQDGTDVLVSFAMTTILVEDITVTDLRSTDNFVFT